MKTSYVCLFFYKFLLEIKCNEFQNLQEIKLKKCETLYSLFSEKKTQHRCFTVNIAKFLNLSILKNICERLLL